MSAIDINQINPYKSQKNGKKLPYLCPDNFPCDFEGGANGLPSLSMPHDTLEYKIPEVRSVTRASGSKSCWTFKSILTPMKKLRQLYAGEMSKRGVLTEMWEQIKVFLNPMRWFRKRGLDGLSSLLFLTCGSYQCRFSVGS